MDSTGAVSPDNIVAQLKALAAQVSEQQKTIEFQNGKIEQLTEEVAKQKQCSDRNNDGDPIRLRLILEEARLAFRFAVTWIESDFLFDSDKGKGNARQWWTQFADTHRLKKQTEDESLYSVCKRLFEKFFSELTEAFRHYVETSGTELIEKANEVRLLRQQVKEIGDEVNSLARQGSLPAEKSSQLSHLKVILAFAENDRAVLEQERANTINELSRFHVALGFIRDQRLFAYLESLEKEKGDEVIANIQEPVYLNRLPIRSAISGYPVSLDAHTQDDLMAIHKLVLSILRDQGMSTELPDFDRSTSNSVSGAFLL